LSIPVAFGLASCAALTGEPETKSESLTRVDDLLARVERVQVEALVSKDRAHAALEALRAISAVDFEGDAQAAHVALVTAIDESQRQAQTLGGNAGPLRTAAEQLFTSWTADLESFGNKSMRKRSQVRMEQTRERCEAVISSLVAAHVAYDAFNNDLHDQALFLANDFNSAAVAVIADDVASMDDQVHELDGRLKACVASCKSYLESNALRGQLETPTESQSQEPPSDELQQDPQARRTPKRRMKPTPEGGEAQLSSAEPANKGNR
jgi:hypothetical protein